MSEIRRRTEQYLEEGLSINQEANRVIEFDDPVVFSLRQKEEAESENEMEIEDLGPEDLASTAFSDIKLLVFVYKRVFREQQIRQIRINERAYYNTVKERVKTLEDAIAADNIGYVPPPIRQSQD